MSTPNFKLNADGSINKAALADYGDRLALAEVPFNLTQSAALQRLARRGWPLGDIARLPGGAEWMRVDARRNQGSQWLLVREVQ